MTKTAREIGKERRAAIARGECPNCKGAVKQVAAHSTGTVYECESCGETWHVLQPDQRNFG